MSIALQAALFLASFVLSQSFHNGPAGNFVNEVGSVVEPPVFTIVRNRNLLRTGMTGVSAHLAQLDSPQSIEQAAQ
jgi:hypothetical protein